MPIIELVQGEGGFNVAPRHTWKASAAWCDKHGILLDLRRDPGGLRSHRRVERLPQFGITPDLSTWAKSLGSGLPIAAVMGKAAIMDKAGPSSIGGTYIGNPLGCAAALATLKYMEEIDINAKGTARGRRDRKRFEDEGQHACIGDVRGLGAMMAVEFVRNNDPTAAGCGHLQRIDERPAPSATWW